MANLTLQTRLDRQLKHRGDHIAIDDGSSPISYRELERRSNIIAHWIRNRGIERERFIGILMDDRSGFITAIVGILKAACVFVPLDPAHPPRRVQEMLTSTGTDLVITDRDIDGEDYAPWAGIFAQAESGWERPPQDVEYCPEDKAYIYFTSGTTGKPKAIVGNNRGLLHFIDWEIETFKIDASFCCSQFTNPGFDVFLRDVLVPLCAGGTIRVPENREILPDGERIADWLNRNQINLIHTVPSVFRLFNGNGLTDADFQQLKYVMLAGEKVVPGELKDWYRVFGSRVQLVNLYGPTETTLAKAYYLIGENDVNRRVMPVGKPIRGASFIVLNEDMEVCDELETGELYIRTPYRTYGYLNDEGMNKEKFIPNPFNDDKDDLLYKTGDLARWLVDGNIELAGRIDRQVKIRGMRVELDEIESHLVKHADVKEAVAVWHENDGSPFLGACVIRENGAEPGNNEAQDQLRDFLAAQLPDYMVPGKIVATDQFPRTLNGKVDYQKVGRLIQESRKDVVAPRDNVEETLFAIWKELLARDNFGVTDNFFELGGNSLNVMSLIAKIHRQLETKVALGDIFKNHSIEAQARIVRKAEKEKYYTIRKVEPQDYYDLSPSQSRLYVLHQMEEKKTAHNIPMFLEILGPLDVELLKRTFHTVTQRHDSLRTSFHLKGDQPKQTIHETVDFSVDYRECDEQEAHRLVENFIQPFPLDRAPLMRITLLRLEEERFYLLLDTHHIVTDGVSVFLFIRECMEIYRGNPLPELRLQYKDYSVWKNDFLRSEELKRQEAFWLKEFSGVLPLLDVKTDFPRPAVQDFEGESVTFQLGDELSGALHSLARREDATLFMVLLAAYNVLLNKISRQEDVVVGTITAGRRHADLENIIGMFVNTLALRNYPASGKSFREFLQEVKKRTLDVFENQEYPFEDLVARVAKNRDLSRNPLYSVGFAFNNIRFDTSPIEFPGLEMKLHQFEENAAKIDFNFIGYESGANIRFIVEYAKKLFNETTIRQYTKYFREIVSAVVSDPGVRIGDIDLLSEEEKKSLSSKIGNKKGTISAEFDL